MSEMLYGKNPVLEAIRNKRDIEEILITANNKDLLSMFKENNIEYRIVSKDYIDSLTKGIKALNQGIIAYVKEYQYYDIDSLITNDKNSLIIMLDGIEDPHNLGAIVRTCEISGCDGIIIPKNRSVKVTSTVAKVSCGAIEHVKVSMVTNLVSTLKYLKEKGYWIVGAEALKESKNIWDVDLNMRICLVIGSEGRGVSRLTKEECDFLVKIPMWGQVNSLNASVSAALIMYEIRRQQSKK